MSTSLRFKLLKFGISLMSMEKLFTLPKEKLLQKVAAFNKKKEGLL